MGLKSFFKGIKEAWDEEGRIIEEENRIAQEKLDSLPKEEVAELEEFWQHNVTTTYVSPNDMADYLDYRKGVLGNLKNQKQNAILFNNIVLTEDFIFNIGYKDIVIKTEDVWAVQIEDPTETVIKDAVYKVQILTNNPAIPFFRTQVIINVDYNIQIQMSQFCELMVSCFKNLRYGSVTTHYDLIKAIQKDKTYASYKEQADALKAANEPCKVMGSIFQYNDFEEKRPQIFEWLESYGYDTYIYHQERKTTEKDKRFNMVKKVFRAVDFTASAIGVTTGSISMTDAMMDWDLKHR